MAGVHRSVEYVHMIGLPHARSPIDIISKGSTRYVWTSRGICRVYTRCVWSLRGIGRGHSRYVWTLRGIGRGEQRPEGNYLTSRFFDILPLAINIQTSFRICCYDILPDKFLGTLRITHVLRALHHLGCKENQAKLGNHPLELIVDVLVAFVKRDGLLSRPIHPCFSVTEKLNLATEEQKLEESFHPKTIISGCLRLSLSLHIIYEPPETLRLDSGVDWKLTGMFELPA